MEVTVETRSRSSRAADVLALPLFELDPARGGRLPARVAALDAAAGGRIAQAVRAGDFKGKRGETLLVHPAETLAAKRLLLIGLGEEAKASAATWRETAALAVRETQSRRGQRLALLAPSGRRAKPAAVAQALAEGAVLGSYRFDRYRTKKKDDSRIAHVALLFEKSADARLARAGAATGALVASYQNLARDLSNEPPNALPPAALAREAEKAGRAAGVKVRVMAARRAPEARLRRAARRGPGQREHAAADRPRARREAAPLEGREGRAPSHRVPGRQGRVLRLRRPLAQAEHEHGDDEARHVGRRRGDRRAVRRRAAAPPAPRRRHRRRGREHAERHRLSARRHRDDAVGPDRRDREHRRRGAPRARRRAPLREAPSSTPDAMVDLATLTGACSVALGKWAAAVLGNHEPLAARMLAAGEAAGERYWRLPLWDVHREFMRGHVADLKQTGGRDGGTITAAAFLSTLRGRHAVDRISTSRRSRTPRRPRRSSPPARPASASARCSSCCGDWSGVKL